MVVALTETGESGKWIHFSGKMIKNKCEHWEIIKDSQNVSKDERRDMLSLSNKKEKGVSQEITDC